MKFSFDKVVDLAPLNGTEYKCGHETNNEVFQYFIKSNRVYNFVSNPVFGNYTDVEYESTINHVPVQSFSTFGVKTFPNIGAYGWFRSKYENMTHVLMPFKSPQVRYAPPTFTFSQNSATVQVNITPPTSVIYTCYRIIFREGHFATEYITYDTVVEVPKPASGTYELYIIGYRDTGEISEETPRQAITIVNPVPPPAEGVLSLATPTAPQMTGNVIFEAGDNVFLIQDTANNKIIINSSGGGGGTYYENPIDKPPSVPSIYDDEFADEVLNPKWNWLYQNSATWNETRGRGFMSVPPQSDSMRVLAQEAPGGNYTIIGKLRLLAPRMNYAQFGLCIYNSANNRRYSFGPAARAGIAADQWIRFTADTTYAGDAFTTGSNTPSLYVRVIVADGSFTAQVSQDGTTWIRLYGPETISSWIGAITHIGLGFFRNNTSDAVPWVGCAEWFRVITA